MIRISKPNARFVGGVSALTELIGEWDVRADEDVEVFLRFIPLRHGFLHQFHLLIIASEDAQVNSCGSEETQIYRPPQGVQSRSREDEP